MRDAAFADLLINEGVVDQDAMMGALAHQEKNGGALETACLELGLSSEETLLQMLSRRFDMPSVEGRELLEHRDIGAFPTRLAHKHSIVPIAMAGRRLRVALRGPPDHALLDEIGFMLSMYIKPEVATEVRIAEALHLKFGVALPERMRLLLDKIGHTQNELTPRAKPIEDAHPPVATEQSVDEVRRQERVSWTIEDAIAEVALSDSRDEMIDVLVRFVYQRLTSVFVFIKQRDGWMGFDGIDPVMSQGEIKALRLDETSSKLLADVLQNRAPFLGPIPKGDGLSLLLARSSKASLAVPLMVGNKTVGVVVGDKGDDAISPRVIADLQRLVPSVGKALAALIKRRKAQTRAEEKPTAQLAIVAESSGSFDDKKALAALSRLRVPETPGAMAKENALRTTYRMWRRTVDSEGDAAFQHFGDGGFSIEGANALASYGVRLAPALSRYFPGRLAEGVAQIDPRDFKDNPTALSDAAYLLARIGSDVAAPILVGALDDNDRVKRYAACALLVTTRVPGAIAGLTERLFDPEKAIARIACLALLSLKSEPTYAGTIELLQQTARFGRDDQRRLRAIAALATLRDVSAIEALSSLLGTHPKEIATAAHRALVTLTLRDHGTSTRQWQAWYKGAQNTPRVQWLIEGLAQSEENIREQAVKELRKLGAPLDAYDQNMSARERESLSRAIQIWWDANS